MPRLFKRQDKGRIVVQQEGTKGLIPGALPVPTVPPSPGQHVARAAKAIVFEHGGAGTGYYTPIYRYRMAQISNIPERAGGDMSELSRQGWEVMGVSDHFGLFYALCRQPVIERGEHGAE